MRAVLGAAVLLAVVSGTPLPGEVFALKGLRSDTNLNSRRAVVRSERADGGLVVDVDGLDPSSLGVDVIIVSPDNLEKAPDAAPVDSAAGGQSAAVAAVVATPAAAATAPPAAAATTPVAGALVQPQAEQAVPATTQGRVEQPAVQLASADAPLFKTGDVVLLKGFTQDNAQAFNGKAATLVAKDEHEVDTWTIKVDGITTKEPIITAESHMSPLQSQPADMLTAADPNKPAYDAHPRDTKQPAAGVPDTMPAPVAPALSATDTPTTAAASTMTPAAASAAPPAADAEKPGLTEEPAAEVTVGGTVVLQGLTGDDAAFNGLSATVTDKRADGLWSLQVAGHEDQPMATSMKHIASPTTPTVALSVPATAVEAVAADAPTVADAPTAADAPAATGAAPADGASAMSAMSGVASATSGADSNNLQRPMEMDWPHAAAKQTRLLPRRGRQTAVTPVEPAAAAAATDRSAQQTQTGLEPKLAAAAHSPDGAAGAADRPQLKEGDRVVLQGLSEAADLNGRDAVVVEHRDDGLWEIRVSGETSRMATSAAHLTLSAAAEAATGLAESGAAEPAKVGEAGPDSAAAEAAAEPQAFAAGDRVMLKGFTNADAQPYNGKEATLVSQTEDQPGLWEITVAGDSARISTTPNHFDRKPVAVADEPNSLAAAVDATAKSALPTAETHEQPAEAAATEPAANPDKAGQPEAKTKLAESAAKGSGEQAASTEPAAKVPAARAKPKGSDARRKTSAGVDSAADDAQATTLEPAASEAKTPAADPEDQAAEPNSPTAEAAVELQLKSGDRVQLSGFTNANSLEFNNKEATLVDKDKDGMWTIEMDGVDSTRPFVTAEKHLFRVSTTSSPTVDATVGSALPMAGSQRHEQSAKDPAAKPDKADEPVAKTKLAESATGSGKQAADSKAAKDSGETENKPTAVDEAQLHAGDIVLLKGFTNADTQPYNGKEAALVSQTEDQPGLWEITVAGDSARIATTSSHFDRMPVAVADERNSLAATVDATVKSALPTPGSQTHEQPAGAAAIEPAATPEKADQPATSEVPAAKGSGKQAAKGTLSTFEAAVTCVDHTQPQPGSSSMKPRTCALVGTSGGLLLHKHGVEIDAHDVIVRAGNGPLKGYETHVGARSDYRVCAESFFERYGKASLELFKNEILPGETIAYATRNDNCKELHQGLGRQDAKCMCAQRKLLKQQCQATSGESWPRDPSTGLLAVIFAFEAVGCTSLKLYGFDSKDGQDQPYHYWKDGVMDGQTGKDVYADRKGNSNGHDFSEEHKLMEQMMGQGQDQRQISRDSFNAICHPAGVEGVKQQLAQ